MKSVCYSDHDQRPFKESKKLVVTKVVFSVTVATAFFACSRHSIGFPYLTCDLFARDFSMFARDFSVQFVDTRLQPPYLMVSIR